MGRSRLERARAVNSSGATMKMIKASLALALLLGLTGTVAADPIDPSTAACKDTPAVCSLQASDSTVVQRILLAEDKPPMPGCKRECTPMKKCTPGPCKRVGDTMVCEKEVCTTVQSCGWVCPK